MEPGGRLAHKGGLGVENRVHQEGHLCISRDKVENHKNDLLDKRLVIMNMIEYCVETLQLIHKYPLPDKQMQIARVKLATKVFHQVLLKKAREEVVEQVSNDHCRHPQDARARVANDAPRRIRIRDILKEKIARCGE